MFTCFCVTDDTHRELALLIVIIIYIANSYISVRFKAVLLSCGKSRSYPHMCDMCYKTRGHDGQRGRGQYTNRGFGRG